ncbi:DUF1643 domain-containing protein [Priestia megaterium]
MVRNWLPNEVIKVEFDKTKKHRFFLSCTWNSSLKSALFIMLNPSWADENRCDDTVSKCIHYAKKINCGSVKIVNLFSLITPNPNDLLISSFRNHQDNLKWQKESLKKSDYVVAAWGEQGVWFNASYKILRLIEKYEIDIYCISTNRYGLPRHPARLSKSLSIKKYNI